MARGVTVRGWKPLTEEEKRDKPKITLPLLKRVFSYLLPYWPRLLLVFLAIDPIMHPALDNFSHKKNAPAP